MDIKFQEGISNLRGEPINKPKDLKNAILDRYGIVRSLRDPNEITSGLKIYQASGPYLDWGSGKINGATETSGGTTNGVFFAGDSHNQHFYMGSSINYTSDFPEIKVFPPDWDGDYANVEDEQPYIESLSFTENFIDGDTIVSSPSKGAIGYLCIPYNSRNEPGIWFYNGNQFVFTGDADPPDLWYHPITTLTFVTNDEVEYIDIYRTFDMNPETGLMIDIFHNEGVYGTPNEDDLVYVPGYYFLGRAKVNGTAATFEDDKWWTTEELINKGFVGPGYIYSGTTQMFEVTTPTIPLDEEFTMLAPTIETTSSGAYSYSTSSSDNNETATEWGFESFTAKTMYNDGGTMLWADVIWAKKFPMIGWADYSGSYSLKIFYYYETNEGTDYSNYLYLTNVNTCKIPYQGEAYLEIYIHDGANWRFYERISSNIYGEYITKYKRDDDDAPKYLTFDGSVTVSDNYGSTGLPSSPGNYVRETNAGFISEVNRPLHITTNQFFTPDEEQIYAIVPSRLAEEESLRSYDFYIFAGDSIYVCQRDGNDIIFIERISKGLTLRQLSLNGLTSNVTTSALINIKLYQVVKGGVIFAASVGDEDVHIYFLTGRRPPVRIDREVSDLFANTNLATDLRDMIYDPNQDQLWVSTYNGLYIYDIQLQQWIGQYNIPHIVEGTSTSIAGLSFVDGYVVALTDESTPTNLVFNESGSYRNAQLYTQPIEDGSLEYKLSRLYIDYIPMSVSVTDETVSETIDGSTITFSTANGLINPNSITVTINHPVNGNDDLTEDDWSSLSGATHTGIVDYNNGSFTITYNKSDPGSISSIDVDYTYKNNMTIEHSIDNDYVSNIDQSESSGVTFKFNSRYDIPPRRNRYPKLEGSSHIFKFEDFQEIKRVTIE